MMSYIMSALGTKNGYWEPHTSSVDFCEPNYLHSYYVAEVHNVWSSMYICLIAILGLIYCNPTNEWRTTCMFATLLAIGAGSVALHGTLHWFWQSSDEIPMLWLNLSSIYALFNLHTTIPRKSRSYSAILISLIGILQTIAYFTMRHVYDFFLFSFISSLTLVLGWTSYLVLHDRRSSDFEVRWWLFSRSWFSFIVIGASLWIFEMHNCSVLLPYYLSASGATFHILWHIGAGTGAYLQILLIIAMRIQALGHHASIEWVGGVIPVVEYASPKVLPV